MTELPEAPRPEELEPVAHVFQDDLHRLQTSECAVTAYSVAMGDPDRGETVPLILASQPAGEPVAWISYDTVRMKERLDRKPIQSIQPGVYKHTPLYDRPQPAIPDVDALAEFIRSEYPATFAYGADRIATTICNWIAEGQQK